jgi:hypothetical protein
VSSLRLNRKLKKGILPEEVFIFDLKLGLCEFGSAKDLD